MNGRIAGLCERMRKAGMDAALLLHHRDVLYYAGTARPASLLVVPAPPSRPTAHHQVVLFARRGVEAVRREATVEQVVPMQGFSGIRGAMADMGFDGGVLGLELDTTPAQLVQRVEQALAGWAISDVSPLILDQRMVKDEVELAATRRAAAVADAGHRALAEAAAPGITELELAAEVEHAMRRAGHEGHQPLRQPEARGGGVLLMSGENLTVRGGHGLVVTGSGLSSAAPYGPSRRAVCVGDLIVLDIGSLADGYTADESRTYVVGEPTPAQAALYGVTRRAEQAAFEAIRPGVTTDQVYEAAQAVLERGAPPHFPAGSLTLPGFVGHGIGLELDEPPILWPRSAAEIRRGMILAVEIEVSAPGAETMMKVEDTVAVLADGVEILTQAPAGLTACR